ncbi:unnamed protein product [Mytilus edulis]|uniref:C-type lectin domain-containing protein n=1 Tax=Mytilus edulis TaxID=6550 RepID=A0A8S3RBG8_MYTED|nr:unnamed protein product [Mytilus edulis]
MIVTGFVILLMWNLIACIQDMRFKELYPSTHWRFSDTAFYLFQQPSTALEVCTVICAQNPVCRAVFIDQDVCFGISTLMSASSMHSKVRTFVKQPSNDQYFELYVGASDGSTEDEWKWVSVTTASDFFYWRKGQPNNEDTQYPNKTANCGAVYPNDDLELQDEYCYHEKRFICEM